MSDVEEFRLISPAFPNQGKIPRKFTGDGAGALKDLSPPLEWYGVPEGSQSLALIVEDPDAPDPQHPIVPWVHWVVINIPPTLKGLPAGFSTKRVDENSEYAQMQEGVNDWKVPGYRGPNPPVGNHRYVFTLYALDTELNLGNKVTKEKVLDAIEGHVLGEARLIGYYTKEKHVSGHDQYMPPGAPHPSGPGFPDVIKAKHPTHR
ncbi:hypothetical protein O6H91_22G030800 [Diphasiastrum complanatum]|uniref:Uncharacterized protein n=1 Tax=Diphasiastrum complanatum TaxID=34168 RepID=A0ACC2AEA7_DIPCM|nr:hypothetical protein O6H91_22G030800 [Diphasiastrum complanatum]